MISGSESTQQRLFLFTDVVNSVGFKTRHGNSAYREEYRRLDDLFQGIIDAVPGAEILQDLGDGRLCTFATSSGAVQTALSLQYGLSQMQWRFEPLNVRVGIHFGEVNVSPDGSISGLAIDTAARVMGLACGRQILMTRTIFDDARAYLRKHPSVNGVEVTAPLRWVSHGEYIFKGLGEPHEIFEVFAEGIGPGQPPPNSEKAQRADSDDLSWRPKAGEPIPFRTPTWILKQPLGAGGFGEVWLGERGASQNVFKFCFDPERLAALRKEVELFDRMHTMLGDRTDIQHVLDYRFENAPPYYVQFEYAGGGSLIDWFKSQGGIDKVPLETRLDIVRQVALALDAAHSVGVLHLDVKPANILMRMDRHGGWQTVLADFGLGKVNSEVLAQQKSQSVAAAVAAGAMDTSGGTMAYMAPEVIDLKPPTTRSDIYSLGVLLYQMVVGNIKSLAPGWEHDVHDSLLRRDIAECVVGNPERRLASARELADRIRELPRRRIHAKWKRVRRRLSTGVAIAALCAIPIVTSVLFERERRLKLEAGDLFQQSVATMQSVFNEAASDELRDLPELVKLRQKLVEYCQSFAQRNQEYLAGYPQYDNLFEEFGDKIRAFDQQMGDQLYERAIDYQNYLKSAGRKIPPERVPELHIKRGELRTDLGERAARDELVEAADALQRALAQDPKNPVYRFLLGECYHNLAYNYQSFDASLDEALKHYRTSQDYFEGLVREFCGDNPGKVANPGGNSDGSEQQSPASKCSRYRQELARSFGYQGDAFLEASDEQAARKAYDASLNIRQDLVEENPQSDERRFELARSYQNSGRLAAWLDNVDDAIKDFDKARVMQLELHTKKRSVVKYKTDLIYSCLREAELYLDQGNAEMARPLIELAQQKSNDLAESVDGIELRASAALMAARMDVQEKSANVAAAIDDAQQKLERLIAFSDGGAPNTVVPSERIRNPQALYDQAVLAAFAAGVASSEAVKEELKASAKQMLELAAEKGYRDRRRFLRDHAFKVFSDTERESLSQAMAQASNDSAASAKTP